MDVHVQNTLQEASRTIDKWQLNTRLSNENELREILQIARVRQVPLSRTFSPNGFTLSRVRLKGSVRTTASNIFTSELS